MVDYINLRAGVLQVEDSHIASGASFQDQPTRMIIISKGGHGELIRTKTIRRVPWRWKHPANPLASPRTIHFCCFREEASHRLGKEIKGASRRTDPEGQKAWLLHDQGLSVPRRDKQANLISAWHVMILVHRTSPRRISFEKNMLSNSLPPSLPTSSTSSTASFAIAVYTSLWHCRHCVSA